MTPRIFGVDYQFLSCGDVFTQGLLHAAEALGVDYAHADWSAPDLLEQVHAFRPDLLFVVHGRKFARWHSTFKAPQSAVWLLDEPYEVDDTAQTSRLFSYVFVNDPATLARHPHASYLPVCYDPRVHYPGTDPRTRDVGFIGGGNATRERYLAALANAGRLSYVVGGAWADAAVNGLCLARNLNPGAATALYRQTRIVLNVFRETHHYNREHLPATSLNPRIYEALACGALVVSEWRPEIETLVPELPTFRSVGECLAHVDYFLAHPATAADVQAQCAARLAGHTYAARLQTVLTTVGSAVAA